MIFIFRIMYQSVILSVGKDHALRGQTVLFDLLQMNIVSFCNLHFFT